VEIAGIYGNPYSLPIGLSLQRVIDVVAEERVLCMHVLKTRSGFLDSSADFGC
jgi:hypothetical protein